MTKKIKELKTTKNICMGLMAVIVICASFYFYFMNRAVFITAEREHVSEKIAILSGKVSELEQQYLSQKNSITLATAHERGFKDVSYIAYVFKGANSDTVAMRNDF